MTYKIEADRNEMTIRVPDKMLNIKLTEDGHVIAWVSGEPQISTDGEVDWFHDDKVVFAEIFREVARMRDLVDDLSHRVSRIKRILA